MLKYIGPIALIAHFSGPAFAQEVEEDNPVTRQATEAELTEHCTGDDILFAVLPLEGRSIFEFELMECNGGNVVKTTCDILTQAADLMFSNLETMGKISSDLENTAAQAVAHALQIHASNCRQLSF